MNVPRPCWQTTAVCERPRDVGQCSVSPVAGRCDWCVCPPAGRFVIFAMKTVRKHTATLNLPTLKLEGGLFLPDVLEGRSGPTRPSRGRLRRPRASSLKTSTAEPSDRMCPVAQLCFTVGPHRLRCTTRHRHFRHRTAARCLRLRFRSRHRHQLVPSYPSPICAPNQPIRAAPLAHRGAPPWAWTTDTALPSPAVAAAKRHSSWPRAAQCQPGPPVGSGDQRQTIHTA